MLESARTETRKLGRALRRATARSLKLSLGTGGLRERGGVGEVRDVGVKPENIVWIFGAGCLGAAGFPR